MDKASSNMGQGYQKYLLLSPSAVRCSFPLVKCADLKHSQHPPELISPWLHTGKPCVTQKFQIHVNTSTKHHLFQGIQRAIQTTDQSLYWEIAVKLQLKLSLNKIKDFMSYNPCAAGTQLPFGYSASSEGSPARSNSAQLNRELL